jgi:hypothetical protein
MKATEATIQIVQSLNFIIAQVKLYETSLKANERNISQMFNITAGDFELSQLFEPDEFDTTVFLRLIYSYFEPLYTRKCAVVQHFDRIVAFFKICFAKCKRNNFNHRR